MSSINGIQFSTYGGSVPFPNNTQNTPRDTECYASSLRQCPEHCASEIHYSTDGDAPYPNGLTYYCPNIHFSTDGDAPYPHDTSNNVEQYDESLDEQLDAFDGDIAPMSEKEQVARWLYY